jgi:hypothetical protein
MWAAGDFTQVQQPGHAAVSRVGTFSFSATTGAITGFNPQVRGRVHTVQLSADCRTAYLGGAFTTSSGARNLAAVNASTGALISTFRHDANAEVLTVLLSQGHLLAGGKFTTVNGVARPYLVSMSPTTGAVDSWMTVPFSGTYGPGFPTMVYDMKPSVAGTRLLLNGIFTSVGGLSRTQIVMLNVSPTSTSVNAWDSPELHDTCVSTKSRFWARGINWSTGDTMVIVASTGAWGSSVFCDSFVRLPSSPVATNMPNIVNDTCVDSLYAVVAVPSMDAYVIGGHQRDVDVTAPVACGKDSGDYDPGPGAQPRPGLAAIARLTGKATAWNPTTSRGHGVLSFLLTPDGLWAAGAFGNQCGRETHQGICFLPNAG